MKTKLGLTILSAAVLATLGGCLGTNNDSASPTNSNREVLGFANTASQSLAKASGVSAEQTGQPDLAGLLRSAGVCDKFIGMVEDISNCGQDCEDGLPQSVLDFVSCFGVKIDGNGSIEDIDTLMVELRDYSKLESCICGGSGTLFSGGYDELKWQTFSAQASVAAGAAFSASQSSAGGAAFNGTSSAAAGSAFNGSQSNAAGQPFSAE